MDFYGAITFNSKNPDWLVNIFLQATFSKQSLAKFKPTVADSVIVVLLPFPIPIQPTAIVHDQRAEFSSNFVVITPGVYVNFGPSTRLLFGARINLQTEIRDSSPSTFVLPFLQLDLMNVAADLKQTERCIQQPARSLLQLPQKLAT